MLNAKMLIEADKEEKIIGFAVIIFIVGGILIGARGFLDPQATPMI